MESHRDTSDLVRIATYGTPEYAHLAKNRLDAEGIPSTLSGEFLPQHAAVLGNRYGIDLLTKASDADQARRLLHVSEEPVSQEIERTIDSYLLHILVIGVLTWALL